MEQSHAAMDWNAHALAVLARQLVREALEWACPQVDYAAHLSLTEGFNCREADVGYMLGIIEMRLDRELGIWINLRRHMDVEHLLLGDAAAMASALHRTLMNHLDLTPLPRV